MAKKKKITAEGRILYALKNGDRMTALQGWQRFGTMRLAKYICDLRKKGYDIKDRWLKVHNRFGEPCDVKEYWLVSSQCAKPNEGTESFDFGQ